MSLEEIISRERPRSRGPYYDPNANPFPRIIVGDYSRLTKDFVNVFRITHIINCAGPELNRKDLVRSGNIECINSIDSETVNIFDWYPKFKETIDRYLRDPSCINVYVHCQAGMNRSAFLTAAYIIKTFRVPIDRCIEKMVRQRPCVFGNSTFLKQLVEFCKD
jgi:hypothetical protein